MSKRLALFVALAASAVALSACVVVPEDPYGAYGHGYGYGQVRVVPPPVVIVPPRHHPRYRHHRHPRRW